MNGKNKGALWQYTFVTQLSESLSLVKSKTNGTLMVLRVTPPDTYDIMKTLSDIRDDNLMTVYDVKLTGDLCLSLCEYIEGVTLEKAAQNRGLFSEEETKRVASGICSGLEALHKRSIVHKDIKPSNVMLDKNGRVRIIDYDIVRISRKNASRDTDILGTAGFASPEHYGFGQTDPRSDIYSVGALMNYLLTGCLPSQKQYSGSLSPVIERCIETDPDNRYSSARQLRDVLEGKLRYNTVVSPKERRNRPFRPLPGFRGTKVFPKILAGIFLGYFALFAVLAVANIIIDMLQGSSNLKYNIYFTIQFLGFFMGLPYIFFGDVFYISEKLYPSNPVRGKQISKALGFVSIGIGVLMIFFYDKIF